jgi:hypothetical protein
LDEELARKIATLDVKVDGHRRPVLVQAVLDAGIEKLRPGGKGSRELLRRMITTIRAELDAAGQTDSAQLVARVAELEQRLARMTPLLTEEEMARVRSYHRYGVSVTDLAKLFRTDARRIRRILGRRDRPLRALEL